MHDETKGTLTSSKLVRLTRGTYAVKIPPRLSAETDAPAPADEEAKKKWRNRQNEKTQDDIER